MIWKQIQRHFCLLADGIAGEKTLRAVAHALGTLDTWLSVQHRVGVLCDGIPGDKTAAAIVAALGIKTPPLWPTQAEVRSGKSIFGKAGDESNLVMLEFPYPMYYDGVAVTRTRCHKLIAEPLKRIFQRTLEFYGADDIARLRLNVYDGCYNYRKTVGGSVASLHSWGIAFDLDAEHNAYACKKPHAGLSRPDCKYFWQFVEAECAVSLGRERDYDWMHFQFARL